MNEFYNGVEWLGAWLVDHAEGETIAEEHVRQWCVEAWREHVKRQPNNPPQVDTALEGIAEQAALKLRLLPSEALNAERYQIVLDALTSARARKSQPAAVPSMEAKIEVLKYAASLCESKNLSFKNEGYRAACDDIKTCLLASIERLEAGEQMEATAPVAARKEGGK